MTLYICSQCGYGSATLLGRCPHCQSWNSFVEKREEKVISSKKIKIIKLSEINTKPLKKIKTYFSDLNKVLGDGVVENEVILLTGEPGIGKSTLVLQAFSNLKTFYLCGEENSLSIFERIKRLKINFQNFLLTEDLEIEMILSEIKKIKDQIDIVIVDSIQTIYSEKIETAPGSLLQLKETLNQIINFAKKENKPFIIIGHITKEGEVAGPKTLEHLVDCVLTFEGGKDSLYRLVRAKKNRFGPTDEIALFEMKESGLVEVKNPIFFQEDNNNLIGKAYVGILEGKKPLFFEIQTLVAPTILSIPRRVVKGLDYNKVLLLLAVLKKYLHLPLDKYDVYVNVVGGISIKSPATDLGLIVSLISSFKNLPLSKNALFLGEITLLGEVRKVPFQEKIIKEGKRLGFKNIFYSENLKNIFQVKKIFNQ